MIFAKPEVIGETVEEIGIFEDDSTVGSRSTRKTGDTTVNVCGGGNLNVSNGQSKRGKDFPNSHPCVDSLDSLTCPNASDLLVLETSKNIGQQSLGPDSIVIGKDNDIGRGVTNTVGHLETLVGGRDSEDTNTLGINLIGKVLQRAFHLGFGNNDDFLGVTSKP